MNVRVSPQGLESKEKKKTAFIENAASGCLFQMLWCFSRAR